MSITATFNDAEKNAAAYLAQRDTYTPTAAYYAECEAAKKAVAEAEAAILIAKYGTVGKMRAAAVQARKRLQEVRRRINGLNGRHERIGEYYEGGVAAVASWKTCTDAHQIYLIYRFYVFKTAVHDKRGYDKIHEPCELMPIGLLNPYAYNADDRILKTILDHIDSTQPAPKVPYKVWNWPWRERCLYYSMNTYKSCGNCSRCKEMVAAEEADPELEEVTVIDASGVTAKAPAPEPIPTINDEAAAL